MLWDRVRAFLIVHKKNSKIFVGMTKQETGLYVRQCVRNKWKVTWKIVRGLSNAFY